MATIVAFWQAERHDWAREFWTMAELGQLPRAFDPLTAQTINRDAWMLRGGQCEIRRASALEVDHTIPLWRIAHLPDDQRRPYYGPRNLRLRCPPCHKRKTATEAAERASLRVRARNPKPNSA